MRPVGALPHCVLGDTLLPATTKPEHKDPMSSIVINIGRQSDGCTYQLHPRSRADIKKRFPAAQLVPTLFVGYDTQADFERLQGPLWKQIAMILTGLTWEQLEESGGVSMYDPVASATTKVA
jgi:hypothetical protein